MATRYHFLSEYTLTSDREAAWAALEAVPDWPSWWRWLKRVDVVKDPTGDDGLGGTYRYRVTSPSRYGFTYTTTVVGVDRPRRIDGESTGDIVGRGRFLLANHPGGGTDLSFAWLVETPKWWMNLLAPIARRAFTWNHDRLMTDFGLGLGRVTGGRVVSSSNTTVDPADPGFHVMRPVEP